MRILRFLTIILLVIFYSCFEKSDVLPTPVASINFLANGTAYQWFEEKDLKSNGFMSMSIIQRYGGGSYSFEASNTHAYDLLPSRSVYFHYSTESLTTNISYETTTHVKPFTVAVTTPVFCG